MGSLYSKTKIPTVTAVAATPAAASVPVAATTADTTTTDAATGDAERAAGIVRRNRALPETIQTSYRGVLGVGDWVPARKSLLGE